MTAIVYIIYMGFLINWIAGATVFKKHLWNMKQIPIKSRPLHNMIRALNMSKMLLKRPFILFSGGVQSGGEEYSVIGNFNTAF